jgi:hypothetical protein
MMLTHAQFTRLRRMNAISRGYIAVEAAALVRQYRPGRPNRRPPFTDAAHRLDALRGD